MTRIHIIQAGGTIDKDYLASNENHGYNFSIGEGSAWHSIARRVMLPYDVEFTSVCRKDSLDMDGNDREEIRKAARHCIERKVVVLHGTDTIRKTAEVLASIPRKTIVLTGAMKPETFRDSDADFNVGMAFAAVQLMQKGVYIALNGNVVPWNKFYPT